MRTAQFKHIALIGNPNSGKSTIFNILTGLHQKIGNFPGITVEKKSGKLKNSNNVLLTDIPGLYDLYPDSLDESVVLKQLIDENIGIDAVIYIADCTHLEKSLLLFSQIADLGFPMVLVLSKIDKIRRMKLGIDSGALSSTLGVEVIESNAKDIHLNDTLLTKINSSTPKVPHSYLRSFFDGIMQNSEVGQGYRAWITEVYEASWLNNRDSSAKSKEYINANMIIDLKNRRRLISNVADRFIDRSQVSESKSRTRLIDRVVIHPISGLIIFVGILFLLFQAIYAWSEWPMNLMDSTFSNLSLWTQQMLGDNVFSNLIAEGLIPGLGGIMIFIPQIALLFVFIGILEASGYMARAVFLSDRIMQFFGLNGRSIVPLISSMACAIPGVMAARTIENAKERLITILVLPFMTCSARLPVYVIFIAVAIPDVEIGGMFNLKGLTLLGLYGLGTLTALLSAGLLSKFLPSDQRSSIIMEMPSYEWPQAKNILRNVWYKVKSFVVEAGKVILVISLVLWFLASYGPGDRDANIQAYQTSLENSNLPLKDIQNKTNSFALESSYAGILGRTIEPIMKPLGFDWKMSIALISSFAAREVFVGTLATIYSVNADFEQSTLVKKLRSEINPQTLKPQYSLATSMSLLIFYVFAMQCMSTLAVVKKETNSWKWPILQLIVMTGIAYAASFLVYQWFSS